MSGKPSNSVAVVGMAGRFPGARNLEQFWTNLCEGRESITFFSDDELRGSVPEAALRNPKYVKARGLLSDIDQFDARFFGYTPREAEAMDPQHRIFLEICQEALDHAGYDPGRFPGWIGVYAGCDDSTYGRGSAFEYGKPEDVEALLSNSKDFLATRVCYKLNLRGPGLAVQTACSTSLVAVQMAYQALLGYQCDLALAGGVAVHFPQKAGVWHQDGSPLSPDGHTRTFDREARGTAISDGAGVAVLKRLDEAIADGDSIYAVILGAAINNDGSAKVSYSAPGVRGQQEVIATAMAIAGVSPETISYLEAHGTATPMGDPAEVEALTAAFGRTTRRGYCALGSVKSNIGHCSSAAGIAGFLKTVLALRHKVLPPSLHYRQPNPAIDFENSPFRVNTELQAWSHVEGPRRAGLSSFGIGGTNAHVVLEEAPAPHVPGHARGIALIAFSAKTPSAAVAASRDLAEHLEAHPGLALADVAFTANVGRRQFGHRGAIVASDRREAIEKLRAWDSPVEAIAGRPVGLLFPGQGAQYVNMGRALYAGEAVFRSTIDEAASILRPRLGFDLREELYPRDGASEVAGQTWIAQPALFAVQYALAKVLESWGIQPKVMAGHSVGEWTAACLAGAFTFEDALAAVAERGRLMQLAPGGAMFTAFAEPAELDSLRNGDISVASVGPGYTVLSGPAAPIELLRARVERHGIKTASIAVAHAFHSAMMAPAAAQFREYLRGVACRPLRIPVVSNVTGRLLTDEQAASADYWAQQLRGTVELSKCFETMLEEPDLLLLEVGPGTSLSSSIRRHSKFAQRHAALAADGDATDRGGRALFETAARMWTLGVDVDWEKFHAGEDTGRVPLPAYPFERQSYWIEPAADRRESAGPRESAAPREPSFFVPSWKRLAPANPSTAAERVRWLMFVDNRGTGAALEGRLRELGADVTAVRKGSPIRPSEPEDYRRLVSEWLPAGGPVTIVHDWNQHPETMEGFYSLLFLAQAIGAARPAGGLRWFVLTNQAHEVTGGEDLHPAGATVLGPCKVIPEEYPGIVCRNIDVAFTDDPSPEVVERVLGELLSEEREPVVAYRGAYRWAPAVEPVEAVPRAAQASRLREGGVYLITGGFGGMAQALASHLAETVRAKLILVGRSAADPAKIRMLEEKGAEVLACAADVGNGEEMRLVAARARARFSRIHGVFHCAGVPDTGGVIQTRTVQATRAVLHPKVAGTLVLEEVFGDADLDFLILASSLLSAPTQPGLGQVAYCAANSFLDAFAARASRHRSYFTAAINWNTWNETGMAVDAAARLANAYGISAEEILAGDGITNSEGIRALHAVLDGSCPRVLISRRDLRLPGERPRAFAAPRADGGGHARPNLGVPFAAPRTTTESQLAAIWQSSIGLKTVGIDDNFFDLGGHSLLAIQSSAAVRERCGIELPLASFFQFPTIRQLAEHIDDGYGSAQRGISKGLPLLIPSPGERFDPFPLTDVQQAYWLGRDEAFDLGNVATHTYTEVEVDHLDVERYTQAWRILIGRHDMLRAVVLSDGTQRVLPETPRFEIPVVSVDQCGEQARAEYLSSVRREMSHQVLPAGRWPLFEIRVSRLTPARVRLHLSFDALIVDAHSLSTLMRECKQFYEQPDLRLPAPAATFRDYVMAEQASRKTELFERSSEYWLARLDHLPEAPALPLAGNPAAIARPKFSNRNAMLPREQWNKLQERGRSAALTPSGLLLAAFSDTIAAWSKGPAFTLNLTLFHRLPLDPDVNSIVGDFTSLTLLEVEGAGGESFRERAQRTQRQLWRDLDHPHMSGVAVMRELTRRRGRQSAAMPVVFTSTLGLSAAGQQAPEAYQFGKPVYSVSQTPQVWLDHVVAEFAEGLLLVWNAIDELFPEGVLEAMFDAYQELLRELSDSDAAWERQWREWIPARQLEVRRRVNRETATESGDLLHSGFARQAARQPGAWAVIGHRQRLTYGELWASAAALSMRLRQRGARPNQLVAVVMEKGCEQVVAVMGILMSGAAYVPLDPALPQQRMRQLLQQAEVKLVATQSGVAERIEWPEGIEVLRVDAIDPAPDARVESRVQGVDDLAYVIYTSGSTGVPKGVMIGHRGAVNTIEDINRRFQVGPGDRVLGLSSLSFDLSVWDIFGVLAAGGALVLPAPEGERDPGQWAELLQREEVTIWNTVPALMQMLVESGAGLGRLRLCLLSGDWIPLGLPGQIREKRQEIEIISLGGATEASIWSIWRRIDEVEAGWKSIPYGKPLANQQFHVLDGGMRDCPEWVTGELYIGGPGLAKGYWGDLERTEERFVRHPVSGERLYKTGDLGRYWEDGSIEFQGREDGQVKVGGYRIELGEIEAALKEHREVKEAVVVAIGEAHANKRLAAYVVPRKRIANEAPHPVHRQLWHAVSSTAALEARSQAERDRDIEAAQALASLTDRLYIYGVARALTVMGAFAGESSATPDEILYRCGIAPRYGKWLRRALTELAGEGLLLREGGSYACNGDRLAQAGKEAPDGQQDGGAARYAATHLPRILTEQLHSAEIYASGDTEKGYQNAFGLCNGIARAAVESAVAQSEAQAPLRILEIGAGYGTTTAYLLPVLPAERTRYLFTDISQFFLERAKTSFRDYRFVEYGILNMEKPLRPQAPGASDFDIVVASSVLHDAASVRKTLRHILDVLAPGGILMLVEETRFHRAFDLTMGLQQGFDRFEDTALRSAHPLLSREQWISELRGSGFHQAAAFNVPGTVSDFMGLDVLLAQGPSGAGRVDSRGLAEFLGGRLPGYMVPSRYVFLDSLPLTANGKVDRKALRSGEANAEAPPEVLEKPRTPLETELLAIWMEALENQSLGAASDFFSAGGDSLVAIRILARIRSTYDVEIPLREFFRNPTVRALADYIETYRWASAAALDSPVAGLREVLSEGLREGPSEGLTEVVEF